MKKIYLLVGAILLTGVSFAEARECRSNYYGGRYCEPDFDLGDAVVPAVAGSGTAALLVRNHQLNVREQQMWMEAITRDMTEYNQAYSEYNTRKTALEAAETDFRDLHEAHHKAKNGYIRTDIETHWRPGVDSEGKVTMVSYPVSVQTHVPPDVIEERRLRPLVSAAEVRYEQLAEEIKPFEADYWREDAELKAAKRGYLAQSFQPGTEAHARQSFLRDVHSRRVANRWVAGPLAAMTAYELAANALEYMGPPENEYRINRNVRSLVNEFDIKQIQDALGLSGESASSDAFRESGR
jgi:hypothetical protein